jgi:23S rRNA pseudouridine1911/1915/1917 synthase
MEDDAGSRLDVVLCRRVPGMSRAAARALIAEGSARVQGRAVKKSYVVRVGDRISVDRLPVPRDFPAAPDAALRLIVLKETEEYVVVDKPPGIPSHPLEPGEVGTVAGALLARYPEMHDVGYSRREPGIVHRLDTYTSGVMLAARTRESFDRLRRALRAGEIEKRYLARCVGEVAAPGEIDLPLAGDPRDRRRVRVCRDAREARRLDAKPALTEILRSAPAPLGSLVELRANQARRHQVRAHLAAIGHPLLGDMLYGGPAEGGPGHHLLHASAIRVGDELIRSSGWKYGEFDD